MCHLELRNDWTCIKISYSDGVVSILAANYRLTAVTLQWSRQGSTFPETLRVSSWKSWPAKTMKSDCPQSNLIWTPLSATLHVASWLSNSNNSLDGLRDRQAGKGSRCPQLSESCQQAVKCLWPFLVHLLFHNIGIFFMSLPAWCMWFVTEQRSVVLKYQEGKWTVGKLQQEDGGGTRGETLTCFSIRDAGVFNEINCIWDKEVEGNGSISCAHITPGCDLWTEWLNNHKDDHFLTTRVLMLQLCSRWWARHMEPKRFKLIFPQNCKI